RLRELGARVVEHSGDYTETVAAARRSVAERARAHFIDDENSRDLFLGYACAGRELHDQLLAANIEVSPERPLVVYLPCGVGGAPGGITYGLRAICRDALVSVFVEPTDSACMLIALAGGYGQPVSVYDVGLGNRTEADRSEEHTSELQSRENLVCRLLLEKKKKKSSHRCAHS